MAGSPHVGKKGKARCGKYCHGEGHVASTVLIQHAPHALTPCPCSACIRCAHGCYPVPQFKDEITAKAITEAAFALLPDITLVSSDSHEDFLSLDPSQPRALFFSPRDSTAPLLRALALDLKGRMRVGEVRGREESALMREYRLQDADLPALVALPKGGEGEGKRVRYRGDLVHGGMLKFLERVRGGEWIGWG